MYSKKVSSKDLTSINNQFQTIDSSTCIPRTVTDSAKKTLPKSLQSIIHKGNPTLRRVAQSIDPSSSSELQVR